MKYRAEIDGLRALAVLPVILFHAGFEWFSGGFVGVDVFFVISGYLITTIIISEMAEDKFSIVNFYERRARRILPALFFVMAACLPFAWLWLSPNDLKDFGQSLVAVSTFSSNILFWLEDGYFDTAAELKPLLHTWSLAVEEQYYILFPIFLMITWRLGIKPILILLSIIFFISLGIAQWGAYNSTTAAFFLLPTRGWELLIGVFAAFYLNYNTHLKSHSLNQVLSLLGFGMIVYSIITFDKTTPFPSLYALIPTIGTGLLILCTVPKTLVHKLLSLKFIIGIGLISYSAYLWHQPLLVFARHRSIGEVSDLILIFLCLASLVMAWFSWKFVEAPFRRKDLISSTKVFKFSLFGILFFSALGLSIHFNSSFFRPYDAEVLKLNGLKKVSINATEDCEQKLRGEDIPSILNACRLGANKVGSSPTFIIIGDSHARALVPGLDSLAKQLGITGLNLAHNSCFPSLGDGSYLPKDQAQIDCMRVRDNIRSILQTTEAPSNVFLVARWAVTVEQTRFDNKEGGLESGTKVTYKSPSSTNLSYVDSIRSELDETLKTIISYGLNPIIVEQIPEVGWNPLSGLIKIRLFGDDGLASSPETFSTSYQVFTLRNSQSNILLRSLAKQYSISYFAPSEVFCNLDIAPNRCIAHIDGEPLYYDDDHVTVFGAKLIAEKLFQTSVSQSID